MDNNGHISTPNQSTTSVLQSTINNGNLQTEFATMKRYMATYLRFLKNDESEESLDLENDTSNGKMGSRKKIKRDNFYEIYFPQFTEVCPQDLILNKNQFDIPNRNLEHSLGTGMFGRVCKCLLKLKNSEPQEPLMESAVKLVNWPPPETGVETIVESFLSEIKVLGRIGTENPNIIKFLGACFHQDGIYIFTELCTGGSLKHYLVETLRPNYFSPTSCIQKPSDADNYGISPVGKSLSLPDKWQLIYCCEQIASGMEYLWKTNRIVHADLAARNILLTDNLAIKICDFGLSRTCLNQEYFSRIPIEENFPFNSVAPECCSGNEIESMEVSLYVDVWAYGILCWEIFSLGDVPYFDVIVGKGNKFLAIKKALLEGFRHPRPKLAEDYIYEEIYKCWENEPTNRPRFEALRQFFQIVRNEVEGKLSSEEAKA